ncbi:tripartite tricarboxylate transporter substrate binding protein [Variovorax sp. NFACC27]|uniref:Tripartite tricarboxylate transporter substrate binding protein n=1 Tax=Variovorax gossypii TaxID=1679495 RepID=A0A431TNZ6_9BURK|nr:MULTISPECIES: tripartite tricarboxylate transporter substrate binding protein [Variovorax]SEF25442.1 Tripartite-type tricarboxylate transporter, receptor component TctC [Variovorax sp. NFACC28]SEG37479.1 Tripartite-type tricarboxylate transporter, receptor component TctC [Variovorax sp. NFACC29]SFD92447.1 Tripartite-type tricarboxylate transporter, receptor component TctC [Variovorax sp. NFACC26]SFH04504.1 Tripartite-type tricarboxylate transporter, receptor component TctC [Variovorax sp. NF
MTLCKFSRPMAALAAAFGLLATSAPTWAAWPDRPITFVVPSAAGGSPDVLSRLVTNEVSKSLGVPVVIENRPGAAGNIGIMQIKSKPADGYTIGYGNVNTLAVNRTLFRKLPYDVERDLVPVAQAFDLYNVLIVPKDSPIQDVSGLVAAARKQPGKLSFGAPGIGTTGHMGGELFRSMAGIDVLFVPYNGGPAALQDLMGGRIDYLFANSSEVGPLVASGKVRALAVSSARRISLLPSVPTLDEAGIKGYETVAWGGVVAPRGTPREVIEKLNAAINAALATPSVREGLAKLGAVPAGGTPADFQRTIDRETRRWGELIERNRIEKLD